MRSYEIWNLVLQGMGIVAVVLAIVAALFKEEFVRLLRKPALHLSLHDESGTRIESPLKPDRVPKRTLTPKRYYHLHLKNTRYPRTRATGASVRLTRLQFLDENSKWTDQPFAAIIQFRWQWAKNLDSCELELGPPRLIDMGRAESTNSSAFKLLFYHAPTDLENFLLDKRHLRLFVKAYCRESESNEVVIQVDWDGEWYDEAIEMARHCIVRDVTSQYEKQKGKA